MLVYNRRKKPLWSSKLIAFIPLVLLLKNAEKGTVDSVVAVEVIMDASSDEDGDSAIRATLDVL